MKKNLIVLSLLLSSYSFLVFGQILSPQEVSIDRQQQQMYWQQSYPHIMQNLLSTDPKVQFKATEDTFLLRPITGGIPPLGYSQLLMIRSEYQKEKDKLPKDATIEQKKKLLSKHLSAFHEKENESKMHIGMGMYNGNMNMHYGNLYQNSPFLGGMQPGINLHCNPYNNYQYCTSDQGIEYKRIEGGDIGNRIEGKVLEQEATKEGQKTRAVGSERE